MVPVYGPSIPCEEEKAIAGAAYHYGVSHSSRSVSDCTPSWGRDQ